MDILKQNMLSATKSKNLYKLPRSESFDILDTLIIFQYLQLTTQQ